MAVRTSGSVSFKSNTINKHIYLFRGETVRSSDMLAAPNVPAKCVQVLNERT